MVNVVKVKIMYNIAKVEQVHDFIQDAAKTLKEYFHSS
jgi:hypothetical protein